MRSALPYLLGLLAFVAVFLLTRHLLAPAPSPTAAPAESSIETRVLPDGQIVLIAAFNAHPRIAAVADDNGNLLELAPGASVRFSNWPDALGIVGRLRWNVPPAAPR